MENKLEFLGHVHLLGQNESQARDFARRFGMPRSQYTFLNSPQQVKSIDYPTVILLHLWVKQNWRQSHRLMHGLKNRHATFIKEYEIEKAFGAEV